ncbi:hypothetical protein DPMN_070472 [Dreissena polymorpha]|uniref:Uncharacterized protein n=1 Tax=Dreissena polymorpha TaxID=45954 RepID=A0A9D4BVN4_DREPO|nr:hypothetical protein DPMN_070472 [Dreissena polymorpha]
MKGLLNFADLESSMLNAVKDSVHYAPHVKAVDEQPTEELICPQNMSPTKEASALSPINDFIDIPVVKYNLGIQCTVTVKENNLTGFEIRKKQTVLIFFYRKCSHLNMNN